MSKKKDKTIYFVRHGQSVDNVSPVFQSVNSPLSPKGKKQAQSIADRLIHLEFDALVASPVLRAKQTAEAIAGKTGKDIILSDLFVERIKPAGIDGEPWTNKDAHKIWTAWEKSFRTAGMKVGEGENYDTIVKRADDALEFLLNRPEEKIVVVTHGYFLRAILARVLLGDEITDSAMGKFQERAAIENTGITVLNYKADFEQDHTWRLWTFNDHAHFAE